MRLLLLIICAISIQNIQAQVFINELHYDNASTDVNEGWEIAGPAGTDLSCYDIILYNGSDSLMYYSENLSGIIDDEGCGFGAVWFLHAGIQNGGPDGIALYNNCTSTLVQFLSYEGTMTALDGPALGVTSTNIGVAENSSTPIGSSLQLTGVGTLYSDFTWQSPQPNSPGSINSGQDFCSCTGPVAEPTTEATGLTTVPACFSVDLSWISPLDAANVIVVIAENPIIGTPIDGNAYTANSGFGLGSTIGANEYVVYNGSGTSVNITNLNMSTTYYIKIFGYNGVLANCEENYLTGGVTTTFTTLSGCITTTPQISSILYNSCNGSNEGIDEIFMFTTGSNPLQIDSISIDYPNGISYCNVGCGTNTNINNQPYIDALNTMAGCTVFTYADPIPPNSEVMVFTGNPPSTVLDYSSQCGSPNLPIYAVFNNNTSTSGRFCNGCSTIRTLIVDFGNGLIDTVSYIATSQAVQDGATVSFDPDGNPTYFISSNCVYPLAVELETFYVENTEHEAQLTWISKSEEILDYYEVQKSTNGYTFTPIGKVNANGNSNNQINYRFNDLLQTNGVVYYRLKMVDFDGNSDFSYIISTENNISYISYHNQSIQFNLTNAKPNQTYLFNIYNLNGQLIKMDFINNHDTYKWLNKGFYLIEMPELGIYEKLYTY